MKLLGLVPLFQVFDMPVAVAFYRDGLGFSIHMASDEIEAAEGRYFHWCWLRHGSVELMLNTAYDANERPVEREADRWRGHGDANLQIDCRDVRAFHTELTAKGLGPGPISEAHGRRTFDLIDPDGYSLTFAEPVR